VTVEGMIALTIIDVVETKDAELTYPDDPNPLTVDGSNTLTMALVVEANDAALTYVTDPSPCTVDTREAELT
jgi:hypothetical protein